ncbi:MAG: ATP-binding protein [Bacteroidia bacterium]
MKNPAPRVLAIVSAVVVATVSSVVYLLLEGDVLKSLVIFLSTAVAAGLVFYFTLENFIYRKIKVIYKNIHSLKAPGNNERIKDMMQTDPVAEVEQEVIDWARGQQDEIAHLKQLARFRKEFLSNVSHELKTPIFNIQGYLHTLLDGAMEDEEFNRRFLEKAALNTRRLEDLVRELETISQLESGKLELEWVKFDMYSLVKDVFDSLDLKAKDKNISFSFKDGANPGFYVYADKDKIRQVLVNLMLNSINYGKENGNTTVGFYDMDEHLLVEVTDDGIGIEKEHLPRLFERFYRVDKSRSRDQGGTGLGLSIVKHIMESHQQTIHVRSRKGIGTTFGFTVKKATA